MFQWPVSIKKQNTWNKTHQSPESISRNVDLIGPNDIANHQDILSVFLVILTRTADNSHILIGLNISEASGLHGQIAYAEVNPAEALVC